MNYSLNRTIIYFTATILLVFSPYFHQIRAETPKERIINGETAIEGAWPSMVSLMPQDSSVAWGHFCGGTLIESDTVLTAAHCVEQFVDAPKSLRVVSGLTYLTSPVGFISDVAGIIIHPNFSYESYENDIALIRLARPVGVSVTPVVPPSEESYWAPGSPATILGWGVLDPEFPVRPDGLQQALISIVSDVECRERLGLDFNASSMICAGVLASSLTAGDGVDACYGDSGGPLLVYTDTGWKVAGITSWGYYCGSEKYWGVYTRAAVFNDWINSHPQIPPYLIKAPRILGIPRVGASLHCSKSVWGGDSPKLSYTWLNDRGQRLRIGANKRHYLIQSGDIGKKIVCRVTARNRTAILEARSRKFGPVIKN